MQALLLAHDNGMDVAALAEKFADWLVTKQKPDGTFDRFCKDAAGRWTSCKAADADDSLLAMRQNDSASARCWLREAMPLRHSARWAVTDEASFQILVGKGLKPVAKEAGCG